MSNPRDKLSSLLSKSNTKHDLVMKHTEVAEEAIAGWEKAEAEALFLKRELDQVLQQRAAAGERVRNLDAALKECMQQLRVTREEQEHRIHDAIMRISREHGKERKLLQEKLEEMSNKVSKLGKENSRLTKILQAKDKLIENLSSCKSQAEADVNTLMDRMQSKENANAYLKYNVHLLEQELEICNKERESNLRSVEASHKQHMDSMKKVMKLERECHRSRLLVQNPRKMDSVVEILGKESDQRDGVKLNSPTADLTVENFALHNSQEHSIKKPNFLTEEETNNAQSWTSSFISESEVFKMGQKQGPLECKTDIRLMDDFVEMEKLARLSMDRIFGSPDSPYESDILMSALEHVHPSEASGKDSLLVLKNCSDDSGDKIQRFQTNATSYEKYPRWLQDIIRLVLRQNYITQRSPIEILEEVRVAFFLTSNSGSSLVADGRDCLRCSGSSCTSNSCDCISWKPPNVLSLMNSSFKTGVTNLPSKEISTSFQSDLSQSICRIVELIERIHQSSLTDNSSQILSKDNESSLRNSSSATSTDYMVRVFQWKNSELGDILQCFVHSCNGLLNGKTNIENFVKELSLSLEWILNHCFSIRDVSIMRNEIKQHFDLDDSQRYRELEDLVNFPDLEEEKVQVLKEQSMCSSPSASLNGQNNFSVMEGIQLDLKEENRKLKQKLINMETVQNNLEGKLQLATEKIEKSMIQLRELEESVGSLQAELEKSKESKRMMEDQIENQKLLHEHLNAQLTDARVKINELRQKSFSLGVELENKVNHCQELESTCLRLQIEQKSRRALMKDQEDRQLQTDWEITGASEKLAECQETILNLGKELRSMASPKEVALIDKVVFNSHASASNNRIINCRSSLLDQMLAEDNSKSENYRSPETKEIICNTVDPLKSPTPPADAHNGICGSNIEVKSKEMLTKYKGNVAAGQTLAVVHNKRCGGGVSLVRKLLLRRNRNRRKKSLTMV